MKRVFVIIFLAISLFTLIVAIDLFMGTKLSDLLEKEKNPFQVMEPGEYAVIALIFFSILIRIAIVIFKKFRKKKPAQGS